MKQITFEEFLNLSKDQVKEIFLNKNISVKRNVEISGNVIKILCSSDKKTLPVGFLLDTGKQVDLNMFDVIEVDGN